MNFKTILHKKCYEIISSRLQEFNLAMQEIQSAANNETKSSAGDKHETARAMAQIETEQLGKQIQENQVLQDLLDKIDVNKNYQLCSLGSLITTNRGIFYLAVSLGKIEVENQAVFVISTQSPIGKLLLTKKESESFSFNGNLYEIESIC